MRSTQRARLRSHASPGLAALRSSRRYPLHSSTPSCSACAISACKDSSFARWSPKQRVASVSHFCKSDSSTLPPMTPQQFKLPHLQLWRLTSPFRSSLR
eukprot:scaffold2737_cov229-Pinguiococcus_pyrenoidosus.AAC.4